MLRIAACTFLLLISCYANSERYVCSIVHFGEVEITEFTRKTNQTFYVQTTFTNGRLGDRDTNDVWSETDRLLVIGEVIHDSSIMYVIDKQTRQALFVFSTPSLNIEHKSTPARCVIN